MADQWIHQGQVTVKKRRRGGGDCKRTNVVLLPCLPTVVKLSIDQRPCILVENSTRKQRCGGHLREDFEMKRVKYWFGFRHENVALASIAFTKGLAGGKRTQRFFRGGASPITRQLGKMGPYGLQKRFQKVEMETNVFLLPFPRSITYLGFREDVLQRIDFSPQAFVTI